MRQYLLVFNKIETPVYRYISINFDPMVPFMYISLFAYEVPVYSPLA